MTFDTATSSSGSSWDEHVEAGGSFRYYDRQFNHPAVKLLPGEYFVTPDEMVLVTILGSCVSACIRDPLLRTGGMNHFMLPDSELGAETTSARYGSFAMEVLVNDLLKRGAVRNRLEAKIFGGGNVLKGFSATNVGSRNIDFVRRYLAAERIPVVAEDLGDNCPRKIYFFPVTGRVMVKRLEPAYTSAELSQERAYQVRLTRTSLDGDVELFS